MADRWRFHHSGRRSRIGVGCVLLAFLAVLFPDVRLEAGAWTRKADINPSRVTSGAAVVDGKVYLMGGMGDGYTDTKHNYMYDPSMDSWLKRADMLTARSFVTAVAFNGIIYTVGGSVGGLSAGALSVVEAYNPATDSWTAKKNLPNPRFGMNTCVVDGIIYSIGGKYTLDSMLADTYAYDPASDTWTSRTSRPLKGTCAVAVYNGLIYTFGGRETRAKPASSGVYVYDPKTDSWTRKKDMPTPRHGLQASVWNDKIYVIGGYYVENNSLAAVEVYDPANDSWEKLADMPEQTALHAQVEVGGKIYVMAGTADFRTGGWHTWEFDPAFHTEVAAGNVSGIWTIANSPYQVNGEITVPDGQTLQIEPRVKVAFMGHHKLNVQGRLLALGTQQDTIRFTADKTQEGWHGVRFVNTPGTNDTSIFRYCSFKYGKANTGSSNLDHCGGAMMISRYDKVRVSNCLFDSNEQSGDGSSSPQTGPAIYVEYASPTVTGSAFSNNVGTESGAIALRGCPQPLISDNVFFWNHGAVGPISLGQGGRATIAGNRIFRNTATMAGEGIYLEDGAAPLIVNNVIVDNGGAFWGAICCVGSSPVLINNTIANNRTYNSGGGLACHGNSDPVLINNIIYGNRGGTGAQVYLGSDEDDPVIAYCDLQGGLGTIQGSGGGALYTGLFESNIDADPGFVSAPSNDYRLSDNSLCIGKGTDSVNISGTWYYAPSCGCGGETVRPCPIDTKPDLGAYENINGTPTVDAPVSDVRPTSFLLEQNYPNPFNPTTVIRYQLPAVSVVRLAVYDMLGREVAVLVSGRQDAGVHEVKFNANGLASGVYLYRLKAEDFVQTRKLTVIR